MHRSCSPLPSLALQHAPADCCSCMHCCSNPYCLKDNSNNDKADSSPAHPCHLWRCCWQRTRCRLDVYLEVVRCTGILRLSAHMLRHSCPVAQACRTHTAQGVGDFRHRSLLHHQPLGVHPYASKSCCCCFCCTCFCFRGAWCPVPAAAVAASP
jgi:hypothetical protein